MHSLNSFQMQGRAYRSKKQDLPYPPKKTTGLDPQQDGGFDGSRDFTLAWGSQGRLLRGGEVVMGVNRTVPLREHRRAKLCRLWWERSAQCSSLVWLGW